jgi:hypothetical protein
VAPGVAKPELDRGVTEEDDIPRISATAAAEVVARRLEEMNLAR